MGLSYLHYEKDEIDQLYLKLTPVIKMIVATLELRMSSRNHFNLHRIGASYPPTDTVHSA